MCEVKLSSYDRKLSRQAELEQDSNTLRGAEEIAAYARIGCNRVRSLIKRGEFPVQKFDSSVAVTTKAAVDDFLYFSSYRDILDPGRTMTLSQVIGILQKRSPPSAVDDEPQVMMCGGAL